MMGGIVPADEGMNYHSHAPRHLHRCSAGETVMSLAFRHLLSVVALLASMPALAGEIILYENEGFGGRRMILHDALPNFDNSSFNDRAASIMVRDGFWEVCTDAYYRGRCVRFGPGEYPDLSGGLTRSISSAREIHGGGPGGPVGEARLELFERRNFGGSSVALSSGVYDFERIGFNDTAEAAIVNGGVWRLCEDAGMRGSCQDFSPGRYSSLGYLDRRVSSAAIVSVGGGGPAPGGHPRATLYESPNFGGRSFTIEGDVVANFDRTGFNDRASSLRIDGGYWLFCTDALFEGTCRTFGPGDYPQLPWEVNRKISSGRRIHEHYPYNNAQPAWR